MPLSLPVVTINTWEKAGWKVLLTVVNFNFPLKFFNPHNCCTMRCEKSTMLFWYINCVWPLAIGHCAAKSINPMIGQPFLLIIILLTILRVHVYLMANQFVKMANQVWFVQTIFCCYLVFLVLPSFLIYDCI